MDYLSLLNEAQRKAVEYTNGPTMVIAGAGSGKTRVLTYRIAHLMQKGVSPFSILALTFTNKAAREMKDRIARITGESEAKNLWMGTFHSVFARILRYEAEKIGYPSNFTIYDTDDAKSLLKSIIKEFNLDDKIYKPGMVYSRISNAKNNLISASAYLNNVSIQADDRQMRLPKLGEIYKQYELRCFKAAAMDFDDLLFKTNILLRDSPEVLYKYQTRFSHILVDEYQDTNYAQYLIIKKLAARHENICVVGDDAQSIYAFRGADIDNIRKFKSDYPDVQIFKLEQNYRSTKTIVNVSNKVIDKNKIKEEKVLWTENDSGEKVKVFRALSDNEEGSLVASDIFARIQQNQLPYSSFAILYRTNAQSRSFEEALRKRNIDYRIYGGLSFYQRKEVKDLLAYFRLTINPADEEALKRVINYPARGIGKTSLEKLLVLANENNLSIWDVLENLNRFRNDFNAGSLSKLHEFSTMIKSFGAMLFTHSAYDLGNHIAQSSGMLKELFSDHTPEGVGRYENLLELLNGLKEFTEKSHQTTPDNLPTLDEYMQDIALLTDADKENENKNTVSLMTIHLSKGLEFPYVYIVGLEEGLFPSQFSTGSPADLEEERRLFYVALTRAEKCVTLSYALSRYRWGQLTNCEPSRFFDDLDPALVDMPKIKQEPSIQRNTYTPKNYSQRPVEEKKHVQPANLVRMQQAVSKTKVFTAQDLSLQEGVSVMHEKFGKGTVVQIEGTAPNQKATVHFDSAGMKQLLLKFARLTILSEQ